MPRSTAFRQVVDAEVRACRRHRADRHQQHRRSREEHAAPSPWSSIAPNQIGIVAPTSRPM
jgi:hypothetical protein